MQGYPPPAPRVAQKQTRPNASSLAGITLQHLISANLIPPGNRNFAVGSSHNINANLTPKGTIIFEGVEYDNPSAFAVAVTRKYKNCNRMSANGWLEVSIADCYHAPTKLDTIRKWYRDNITKNLPPQPLPEYRDQFVRPQQAPAPPAPQNAPWVAQHNQTAAPGSGPPQAAAAWHPQPQQLQQTAAPASGATQAAPAWHPQPQQFQQNATPQGAWRPRQRPPPQHHQNQNTRPASNCSFY